MSTTKLTRQDVKYGVYGGCIVGGGGGGWIEDGLSKGSQVFEIGQPTLVTMDELDGDDYVACVSLVGAPSAPDIYINKKQLISTVENLQSDFDKSIKA